MKNGERIARNDYKTQKRVYANLRKPFIFMVPEARIELAWTQGPEDFESEKGVAGINSNIS